MKIAACAIEHWSDKYGLIYSWVTTREERSKQTRGADFSHLTAIRSTVTSCWFTRLNGWKSPPSCCPLNQVYSNRRRQRSTLYYLKWFTNALVLLPRVRSAQRRMSKTHFVLNEMMMEIEELTEATSHGFESAFSCFPLACVLFDLCCLIPKGPTGTS